MVAPLDGLNPSDLASSAPGALNGIRVVDLSTGIAGPAAAMFMADFGADVIKVEPPEGDPGRGGPGFPLWNRNKRGTVMDASTPGGADRLAALLKGADVVITGGDDGSSLPAVATPEAACAANPALVYLRVPPYLDTVPWPGGKESAALLHAYAGLALRQNSYTGSPIDPAFAYVLYAQAVWAGSAGMAALIERERSGHGQVVTVGGVHGMMITSTSALMIDLTAPERKASNGPGGPSPLYTRYQCADGKWVFMATLLVKFQRQSIITLGLTDLLDDERIGGELENTLLPANRDWVRAAVHRGLRQQDERRVDQDPARGRHPGRPPPRAGRVAGLRAAASLGMRAEIDDPERGQVVMPANPIKLSATPATVRSAAPRLGEHDGD